MENLPSPVAAGNISLLENAHDESPQAVSVLSVIGTIGSGSLAEPIRIIRDKYQAELVATNGDHKEAKRAVSSLKKALPAVQWSGVFSARGDKNVVSYSGLLCADLDHLDEATVAQTTEALKLDPHCFTTFVSPTGTGVKVVFRVSPSAEDHPRNFEAVKSHVLENYALEVDEACKNMERLCFLSDGIEHLNKQATPLELLPELPQVNGTHKSPRSSSASITPRSRQDIATKLLGGIEWTSDTEGFGRCPGEHLHTGENGQRDFRIMLDGVPTVTCFHNSCERIVVALNHQLRSDVGKAEFVPMVNTAGGATVATESPTTDDPDKRKPLTVRRPSEILAMEFDDSDNILGDRVLAKGQYLTILGAGGLGKSRLALQLAASCITGIPFPGLESRATGMRWLFIQAENSCRRLQADLEPLRRWAGDKWADLDQNLFIHTIENDDDGFLCLANPETQDAIRFLIDATQPDVIVFDPLKDFATGDLNKDSDMTDSCRVIAQLTRRGNPDRACVVLHHAITGKSGAARAVGYDRSSFGRNSKVLQAWTRAQINVAPGSADSNEVLVVSCGKLSNGKEFAPYAVRLNQETMIYELDPKFDFAAWESETTGRTVAIELTSERVASLCVGAMAKAELVKAIMDDTGVAKTKAYGSVAKAEKSKRIQFNPVLKTYVTK